MDDVDQGKNLALGYLCCFIAVLFFGSNYLPVKKFDAGDGFFFQWILCIGIWVTGWICGCIAGWPDLTPSIREAVFQRRQNPCCAFKMFIQRVALYRYQTDPR
eukprot:GEMP01129886.1.p1 GENE.GEMP01129886.1~~GEMP01129886.1.p1  ORF type:complete len:103 (-),score=12.46 GEMP01129886.1:193-501(-)